MRRLVMVGVVLMLGVWVAEAQNCSHSKAAPYQAPCMCVKYRVDNSWLDHYEGTAAGTCVANAQGETPTDCYPVSYEAKVCYPQNPPLDIWWDYTIQCWYMEWVYGTTPCQQQGKNCEKKVEPVKQAEKKQKGKDVKSFVAVALAALAKL